MVISFAALLSTILVSMMIGMGLGVSLLRR